MEFTIDVARKKASAHGVKGWRLLGIIERCGVGEQLTVQLNQKGDFLLLITEGVIDVYDWNEGEVGPLQFLWPLPVECRGETIHYFSLCGTWTDSASTRGCADIPLPLLKFCTCSSRSKSLATSHLMLSISFRQWPSYQTPFIIFQLFSIQ